MVCQLAAELNAAFLTTYYGILSFPSPLFTTISSSYSTLPSHCFTFLLPQPIFTPLAHLPLPAQPAAMRFSLCLLGLPFTPWISVAYSRTNAQAFPLAGSTHFIMLGFRLPPIFQCVAISWRPLGHPNRLCLFAVQPRTKKWTKESLRECLLICQNKPTDMAYSAFTASCRFEPM